jgi:hypothetical protein
MRFFPVFATGYVALPALDRLDSTDNLPFENDFRSLYATLGERWWGMPAGSLFGPRIRPLEILRS